MGNKTLKSFLLSKYDDIFEVFINQYVKTQDAPLTVFDDGLSDTVKAKWNQFTYIDAVTESNGSFSFAKTVNRGLQTFVPEDILFYSDDCYIHTSNVADKLSSVAYKELSAGLVVPTMTNVWCILQDPGAWAHQEYFIVPNIENKVYSNHDISAVCFFLKREVINKVGLYDENFVGACEYGDLDYSIRIRQAGYRHIIVQSCFVEHGGEHFGYTDRNTRRRAKSADLDNSDAIENRDYFLAKWKLT